MLFSFVHQESAVIWTDKISGDRCPLVQGTLLSHAILVPVTAITAIQTIFFFFPFIRRPWSRNDKELSLLPANRLHCRGFAVNIGEDATCWTCTCFLISRLCFYSLQPCALHTKHVTVGDIFTGISLPKSKSYIQSYTPAHFILTPWPRDDRHQE